MRSTAASTAQIIDKDEIRRGAVELLKWPHLRWLPVHVRAIGARHV